MHKIILALFLLFSFVGNAQIGFESRVVADSTNRIIIEKSIEIADVDSDGDLDLILAAHNRIAWYKNLDGLGTFSDQIIIDVNAEYAKAAFPADLDGDGDVDIITADQSGKFAVYKNIDGAGNFQLSEILISGVSGPRDVYAGDIDGDGDLDIMGGANDADMTLFWFENLNGTGSFGNAQEIYSNTIRVTAVQTADIDGDGDLDFIAGKYLNTLGWYENLDGQGNFGYVNQIGNPYSSSDDTAFDVKDIDGDGDNDIVATIETYNNAEISWYENLDGLGTFSSEKVIYSSSGIDNPSAVKLRDIDGDGDQDVIATFSSVDKTVWFKNLDGNGNFSSEIIINNQLNSGKDVEMGDLDSDGDLDTVSVYSGNIAWNKNMDGLGNFERSTTISANMSKPRDVCEADIDGDGDMDLVIASEDDFKVGWFENLDGQGTYGIQKVISSYAFKAFLVVPGDIDGDGDIDLLSANNEVGLGTIMWYENLDGLGNFSEGNEINANTFQSFKALTLEDFDGDNDLDLLLVTYGYNEKLIWFENLDGNGTFDQPIIIQGQGGAITAHQCIDIDFDGDKDIVVAAGSYGRDIYYYENVDGLGNFSTLQNLISVSLSTRELLFNDMDNDGDQDLVIFGPNHVFWYENIDGQTDFSIEHQVYSGNNDNNTEFGVADLDNDNDLDIVFGSYDNGTISYLENLNGYDQFATPVIISNELAGLEGLIITDIDGDASVDIAVVNWLLNKKLEWFKNLGHLNNQISGTVTFDVDNNGCSPDDAPVPQLMVITDNGTNSFSTFTQPDGSYLIYTNEGDFTTIVSSTLPNYYSATPAFHTSNFPGIGYSDEANFCFETTQTINDISISLYPLNDARPGFEASYQLVYTNIGTTTLSDAIALFFSGDKINFVYANQPVISQTSSSVFFNYDNLLPFETRTIDLTFNVEPPPTTNIGDILNFQAIIYPTVGDNTEFDNTFNFLQMVIGSYDPNDIQVLEGAEILLEDADKYLHYIIRFQNTGTAPAINVRITNELDPNLDWSTMQLENISHSNRVEITDQTNVTFIFEDINLPDATTNEAGSHGYIQYKIKPINTVAIGDIISNNANIYFDFNPAILTNTVTTTIVDVEAVEALQPENLEVCGVNENGTFNLTQTEPEVLGALDPAMFVVSFHLSQVAAENNDSPIDNPGEYGNITNPQTIYVRLERISDGVYDTTTFDLIVNLNPATQPISDFVVADPDGDGFTVFDLTQKIPEIIGSQTDVDVTFYETENDAINETNQILDAGNYINITNPQTIFARLGNNTTSCFSTISFIIIADTELGSGTAELATVLIYPNPTSGLVNIQTQTPIYKVRVLNNLGISVLEVEGKDGIKTFSVDKLSEGIYFIELTNSNSNSVIKKLVKS